MIDEFCILVPFDSRVGVAVEGFDSVIVVDLTTLA